MEMSKERLIQFDYQTWLSGTIMGQRYDVKGLFIDVCVYYWSEGCELNFEKAKIRYPLAEDVLWKQLERSGVMKVLKSGKIRIDFLDKQWEYHDRISAAGKRAATTRWAESNAGDHVGTEDKKVRYIRWKKQMLEDIKGGEGYASSWEMIAMKSLKSNRDKYHNFEKVMDQFLYNATTDSSARIHERRRDFETHFRNFIFANNRHHALDDFIKK